MRRRDFLAGAGAAVGASLSFPTPAIQQAARQLTMVTDWPEGTGMQTSARRLAETIAKASQGRIRIEVTSSGALVRPFETFDAVQAGVVDMFHSHIGYFEKRSPAFHFFSGMPFGLAANELFAWVQFGGGQEVWDALSGQFNIKPLLCSSTGAQMGGWFSHAITSPEDFRGVRYRMAGPGAEVLRRLGAIVVVIPGADIVLSLQSGAIDACEWIGPWMDMKMGLHKAAVYYYYPAWQEPGTALALGINKGVWEGLDQGDRQLIEMAAASEYAVSLAEFNTNNARALRELRAEGTVKIQRFDDSVLKQLWKISMDVVAEMGSGDEISRRIFTSYQNFRALSSDWTDIAERAYLNIRNPAE